MQSTMLVPILLASVLCDLTLAAPLSTPPSYYITLEEHLVPLVLQPFQTTNQIECLNTEVQGPSVASMLGDINSRLTRMDQNKIRTQILSINPNPYVINWPRLTSAANAQLADTISAHHDRFRGFCMLPMAYPEEAAAELKVCVEKYGFLGALVDNHLSNGTYYDGERYEVFWEAVEELNVTLYLHPTFWNQPLADVAGGAFLPNNGSYSLESAAVLATSGWGWHSDTGLHFLRLWLAGVFDRHRNLKIIMGHMGEMLPYMLGRVNGTLGKTKKDGIGIYEAYSKHVWLTTSGFFDIAPFLALRNVTSIDRILFSVDYPYASLEQGTSFMNRLRVSGVVTEREWTAIAYANAATLFNIG